MTSLFSNMTTAWPPVSEETAARLKRLEELQQKRLESEKRLQEQQAANTAGVARAAISSRRSNLGASTSRLSQGRELRLKSYKERLGGSVNSDIGAFNQTSENKDFGGARPKVVGSSLGLDRTQTLGRDRHLSSTDTEDEDSQKLFNRSQSYTLLSTEPSLDTVQVDSENLNGVAPAEVNDGQKKEGEVTGKMEDDSMEEENFEQFRDSLYGKNVSKTKPEYSSLFTPANENVPDFSRETTGFSILSEEPNISGNEYSSNTFPRQRSSISDRYKPRRGLHSAVKESMSSINALFDKIDNKVPDVSSRLMSTNYDDSKLYQGNRFDHTMERSQPFSEPFSVANQGNFQGVSSYLSDIGSDRSNMYEKTGVEPTFGSENKETISLDIDSKIGSLDVESKAGESDISSRYEKKQFKSLDTYFKECDKVPDLHKKYVTDTQDNSERWKRTSRLDRTLSDPMSQIFDTSDRRLSAPVIRSSYTDRTFSTPVTGSSYSSELFKDGNVGGSSSYISRYRQNVQPSSYSTGTTSERFKDGIYQSKIQNILSGGMKKLDSLFGFDDHESKNIRTSTTRTRKSKNEFSSDLFDGVMNEKPANENVDVDKVEVICNDTFMNVEESPKVIILPQQSLEKIEEVLNENDSITEDIKEQGENQEIQSEDLDKKQDVKVENETVFDTSVKGDTSSTPSENKDIGKTVQNDTGSGSVKTPEKGKGKKKNKKKGKKKKEKSDGNGISKSPKGDKSDIVVNSSVNEEQVSETNQMNTSKTENQVMSDTGKKNIENEIKSEINISATDSNIASPESSPSKIKGFFNALLFGRDSSKPTSPTKESSAHWEGSSVDGKHFTIVNNENKISGNDGSDTSQSAISTVKKLETNSDENSATSLENFETASEATDTSDVCDNFYETSEESQKNYLGHLEITFPMVERREIFINEPVGIKLRRKQAQEKRFNSSKYRNNYGQFNKGVLYFGQDNKDLKDSEEQENEKTLQETVTFDYQNKNNAYEFTTNDEDNMLCTDDRKGSETPDTLIELSDSENDKDLNGKSQGVVVDSINDDIVDEDVIIDYTTEQDVIVSGINEEDVISYDTNNQHVIGKNVTDQCAIDSRLADQDVIVGTGVLTEREVIVNDTAEETYLDNNDFKQTVIENNFEQEQEFFTEINGISARTTGTQTDEEYVSNVDLLLQKIIPFSGNSSEDRCISVAEQIILKQFCEKCKLIIINNQGPSAEAEVREKGELTNGQTSPLKGKPGLELSAGKRKLSNNGNMEHKPPSTPRSNGKSRDSSLTKTTVKSSKKAPSPKRSPKATPPASPRSSSLTRKSASTPTKLSPKASPGQNRRGKVKGINEMLYDRQNSTGSSENRVTEQKSSNEGSRSEIEIKRIAEQLYSASSETSKPSKKKLPPALLPKPYVSREQKLEKQNSVEKSTVEKQQYEKTSSDLPSYMAGTKSSQRRNNSSSERKQLNETSNSEKSDSSSPSYMNETKTSRSRSNSISEKKQLNGNLNLEKPDSDVPSYMAETKSSRSRSNSLSENKVLTEVFNSEKMEPDVPSERKSRSRSNSISEKKQLNGNSNSEKPDSDVPSYMAETKSSRSRSNSLSEKKHLTEVSLTVKKTNGSPTKRRNSKQGNPEDDNTEHISTLQNNPFIRSDVKKRKSSKKDKGLKSEKQTENVSNSKNSAETVTLDYGVKSENSGTVSKKQNIDVLKPVMLVEYPAPQHLETTFSDHIQTTNISSDNSLSGQNFYDNDERKSLSMRSGSTSISSSKTSLTSGYSLIETDLDEAMGFSSKGGKIDGDDIDSRSDISETSSHRSFAEEACSGLTNMEYINNDGVKKVKKRPKTPTRSSSSIEGKPPRSPREQEKAISQEEAAGVPIDRADNDVDDEIAPKRINLRDWDPHLLLKDLYRIEMIKDDVQDISDKFVNMEGLMEKLPMNKKKATLLKTWKRRFFRAKDGWLHYFETSNRDKPSDSIQLMGGRVDDLGNRILGIDDGRGRYLMVRCPTENEYGQWKLALETQTADNVKATYIRPCLKSPPNPNKKIIVIDLGSSGIRAGILGQEATLPEVFFPSVIAKERNTGTLVIGENAYRPNIRHKSVIQKPVRPTNKGDKDQLQPLSLDMDSITELFKVVFERLKIQDVRPYWIMLCTPQTLGDKIKEGLMKILVEDYHTQGVCMVQQSLLELYSYNATSGVIVDIGERMEILPIYDGYVIEGGVSRQSYGGPKVAESLKSSLIEHKYKFLTPVEQFIVRHVMEQSCYVSDNYKDSVKKCEQDPESCRATVYLNNYDLPEGAHLSVTHDLSCFKSPEGFFNSDMWGMDYPCVHKLVFQAIQSCPIDSRKHMYRSVYLSGGTTLLPGFAERLQTELTKLAPPSVVVEVHGSPQRYHSAFIGACAMAKMAPTEQTFISAEEWKKLGHKAFKKWSMGGS